ncbi:hypothetical protein BDZ97DRAFT_246515 [Flammula alnicola]|nr:hypothetical protein BDZ97DRAFT_246515 [Flammula alnicola]
MHAFAYVLAFATSAFAYSVLSPNAAQGWTNQGAQLLTWTRVDTDRQNFTALLTNQQISGYNPQVLDALVDGTLGKINVNPPSGGWPTGSGFRVNLVQDATDLNAILAQSDNFTISQSSSTLSGSTTVNTATGITIITTPTPTTSGTDASNTDPIVIPTKNAATSDFHMNAGLLGLLSLLGFALA